MIPYFETENGVLYQGHVLDVLKGMEPESINMICTSPPYWGLCDYGLDPIIWDDPGDCEHVWGNEMISKKKTDHKGLKASSDIYAPRKNKRVNHRYEEDDIVDHGNQHGSFCQKCGAWKGSLGLEPTPYLFIKHQVEIFREVRRILRKDGTCWVNMGDSYTSGGNGGHRKGKYFHGHTKRNGDLKDKPRKPPEGLKAKDLCLIPERLIIALQEDGWYVRFKIPWIKRNCMPESCKDRPTNAIEYFYLLAKSKRYYYDYKAVRLPASFNSHARYARGRSNSHKYSEEGLGGQKSQTIAKTFDHMKKPSGWEEGSGKHGKDLKGRYPGNGIGWDWLSKLDPKDNRNNRKGRIKGPGVTPKSQPASSGVKANDSFQSAVKDVVKDRERRNSDWFFDSFQGLYSDENGDPLALIVNSTGFSGAHYATYPPKLIEPCILAGCPRGGTVLDPFAGSGTTCFISERLGRKWVGIDMNCKIGKERITKETKQRRLF